MSWSISTTGTAEQIAAAVEEQSGRMTGQSKVEFDGAKNAIVALLKQNFAAPDSGYVEPVLKLDAYRSGSARNDGTTVRQIERSCAVKIGRA